jgi:putative Ca2+/H+ antiporter (TMEM165/GDT1 family)
LDLAAEAFAISLLSVSAAELGDKTQLGLIMLAASLRKPRAIFLGMIAGYAFVAGVGVLVGQAFLAVVPLSMLTLISGLVFIAVGLLMLKVNAGTDAPSIRSGNPFQAASLMIVLTELGDKTQVVTIALAARFAQPVAVFSGVLLALAIVDGLSIILAGHVGKRLPTSKVKKVSAIVFIVLGILTVLGIA